MIKAVLFDLDGTLLDRDASLRSFIEKQYDRLRNELAHIAKEEYVVRFTELDNRGYVWKDKVYQQVVDDFAIEGMDWEELLQDYIGEFKHYCVPFPNLISMLEGLKDSGIQLGIITNGYGQFQMDTIKALGIEHYFKIILVSEWEGLKKPDPAIFRKALKQLDVTANEALFVGDHPENDIRAAKQVGMKTVWKKDIAFEETDADFIINDLAELISIIEKLS